MKGPGRQEARLFADRARPLCSIFQLTAVGKKNKEVFRLKGWIAQFGGTLVTDLVSMARRASAFHCHRIEMNTLALR